MPGTLDPELGQRLRAAARWLGVMLTALGAAAAPAGAQAFQNVPYERTERVVEAGDFSRIYEPSVGESGPWYYNDHTFIRDAASGTWNLYGITHAEPANPEDERFFGHATAAILTQPQWVKQPFALEADPAADEDYIWAPHVIYHDGLYYMFYAGGDREDLDSYKMQLATSPDLVTWTRHPDNPLFEDGWEARDPMVTRVGDRWVMYYTATSDPNGGNHIVAYRTSSDLVNWSERRTAFRHPATGTGGGPTESPTVVRQGDDWYLFVCCDGGYRNTKVYRSQDPFNFDFEDRVGAIDAHAAEVVQDTDRRWYVSHAGWGQGGVWLAPLDFAAERVTRGRAISARGFRADVQSYPEAALTSLEVDPDQDGVYTQVLDESARGTLPYMAVGAFGDTDRPGPAGGVEVSGDGRQTTLRGIPIGNEPVTADWTFDFADESFDMAFDWHVGGLLTAGAWETGWSLDTNLPRMGDRENLDRAGDRAGFPDWTIAHDDERTVVAAYKEGSAWSEDNVWYNPPGGNLSWQPLWQPGGRLLAPGDYAGGTWRVATTCHPADVNFADQVHAELNGGDPVTDDCPDAPEPSLPAFSIGDVTVHEGDAGEVNAVFTITKTGEGAADVRATSADGSARAPGDYTALSERVVSFAPGDVSKTVSLAVKGDTAVEGDEDFFVNLSAPTAAATLADAQARALIRDDDEGSPPAVPAFAIGDVTVDEGDSGVVEAIFTITKTGEGAADVRVDTADGSATTPDDYSQISGRVLSFAAGEAAKTVSVSVHGDTVDEDDEDFSVDLSAPTAGAKLEDPEGRGAIRDDDVDAAPGDSSGQAGGGQPDGPAQPSATDTGSGHAGETHSGSRGCLARSATVDSRGVGALRLGRSLATLVRHVGAPTRSSPRASRWCVQGGGDVSVVLTGGRARLIASTARGYRAGAVRVGRRLVLLRRANPRIRRLAAGIYTAARGSRIVFTVRAGKVRSVAVGSGPLIRNRRLLHRYFRTLSA